MDGGCQEDAIENAFFFFVFFLDFININFLVPAQCTTLTLITLQLHNGSDFALIKFFYSGSYLNKIQNTGGPPFTGISLPRIPLPRFFAYVHASGGFSH